MRALPKFPWRIRNPLCFRPLSPAHIPSPRFFRSARYRYPTGSTLKKRNNREQSEHLLLRVSRIWNFLFNDPETLFRQYGFTGIAAVLCGTFLTGLILSLGFDMLLGTYPYPHEARVMKYLERKQTTTRQSEEDSTLYGNITVDHFRLFVLEPGLGNEIRGRFVVEQIGRPFVQYEALSYHWGGIEKTATIHCNHHELKISESLHDALRELRLPYTPRLLWIDALCINQDDVDERSKQVSRMRDIYRHAYRVMIWLGKETEDVEGVFNLLYFLRRSEIYEMRAAWRRIAFVRGIFSADSSYLRIPRITGPLVPDDAEAECWLRMYALLCRPWFHRVWILQEIVHARRATVFMSRATEMDWCDFVTAISRLSWVVLAEDLLSGLPAAAARTVREIQRARLQYLSSDFLHEADQKRELFQMLLMASSSECTDPRDRIYAVLSLANDIDTSDLEGLLAPDYKHETTPEEVYRRFALWCTLCTKNLGLLSCANLASAADRSLPSWVPDWRNISSEDTFTRFSDRIPFRAGRPNFFTFGIEPNPEVLDDNLLLSAKRVDSIRLVGYAASRVEQYLNRNVITARIINGQIIQYLSRIGSGANLQNAERFLDSVFAGKEIPDFDFYRYMVCGLTVNGSPASTLSIARLRSFYRKVMEDLNIPTQDENGWFVTNYLRRFLIDGDPEQTWKFDRIATKFERWTKCRTMGLTDAGRMCWLPPDAKKGDLVYIVPGCQVPYVFRREDSGKYTLIGEAYIHGIMFGEEKPKTRRELERLTIV